MLGYLNRFLLIALTITPVYILLRRPWRYSFRREVVLGCFVLFMAAFLVLALEGDYGPPVQMLQEARRRIRCKDSINLTPFHTISSFFHYMPTDDFLVNIGGNVVMFVPWGFGLVLLWKRFRKPLWLTTLCLLLTVSIEFIQLFVGRHVDVDDLILNFTGGLLGALLWLLLKKRFPSLEHLEK